MDHATPLARLWLFSDARNDAGLEEALARLPAGNALIYRHYHLGSTERRARFDTLAKCAREHGHTVVLSGTAEEARQWGADGIYGAAENLGPAQGLLRIATAHNAQEIAQAHDAQADALFLSPVFATRSHPDAQVLGIKEFHTLAATSRIPVIALGGMTAERAQELDWPRWGAIDGLSAAADWSH